MISPPEARPDAERQPATTRDPGHGGRGAHLRSTPARVLRALPTLFRIGVAETLAYRAEFVVWILTTTQPLIMLGLWTSVARLQPFTNYSAADFVAYFLAALIVRQLAGNWVA